jgi:hypothetical protein
MPVIPEHTDLESFLKIRIKELSFLTENIYVESEKRYYNGKRDSYIEMVSALKDGTIKDDTMARVLAWFEVHNAPEMADHIKRDLGW